MLYKMLHGFSTLYIESSDMLHSIFFGMGKKFNCVHVVALNLGKLCVKKTNANNAK